MNLKKKKKKKKKMEELLHSKDRDNFVDSIDWSAWNTSDRYHNDNTLF